MKYFKVTHRTVRFTIYNGIIIEMIIMLYPAPESNCIYLKKAVPKGGTYELRGDFYKFLKRLENIILSRLPSPKEFKETNGLTTSKLLG